MAGLDIDGKLVGGTIMNLEKLIGRLALLTAVLALVLTLPAYGQLGFYESLRLGVNGLLGANVIPATIF